MACLAAVVPEGSNGAARRLVATLDQLSSVIRQQGLHPEVEGLVAELRADAEKVAIASHG